MSSEAIVVRGARVNNLKNISFEIPLHQMTVVTGVSGSGKSSLAFDTVYAEGQRRYVESLSAYARQFLERMDKPDVDEVSGICPAIAIRQRNSSRNPRSTVATQTEIFDYLRLLFARVGRTICHNCGAPVRSDSPQSIADLILRFPEGARIFVMFPATAGMSREANGDSPAKKKRAPVKKEKSARPAITDRKRVQAHLLSLMQRGFNRLVRGEQIVELATSEEFGEDSLDAYCVLVDRLAVGHDILSRLTDSLEICFQEGHGEAVVQTHGENPQVFRFSEKFQCKKCSLVFAPPEPRLFSFNSPYGACPTCQGFGNTMGLDMNLVIPNPKLSLNEGAIEPWTKPQFDWIRNELRAFCKANAVAMDVPFRDLPLHQQKVLISGADGFPGVRGFFEWLETKKYKLHVRVFLSKYRGYAVCGDCGGGRLRQEARNVQIEGKSLPEVAAMTVAGASSFFESVQLAPEQAAIAEKVLFEVQRRLRFLLDVGLDYLTLDRLASTLSGGEAQRIQLATSLGSALVGALYVLDEPSIGLHPRDTSRLVNILCNLRDIGNTVLVVEHDRDTIQAADWIIDIGLGAGEQGGDVVFQGPAGQLQQDAASLTGKYLRGELEIKIPKQRREPANKTLKVRGARAHNLRDLDLDIPLNLFACITGVSGSGKSTLVHEIIYANLKKQRGEWTDPVGACDRIEGGQLIDNVLLVDQSPIGRTPRSNPVTYIKVYDAIREIFAGTREAKAHGYDASHFSFNVPGGRCDRCEGNGVEVKEMQFLADVELICEECKGTRFKSGLLDVRYKGKNIHEVLRMTVRESIAFFSTVPRIANRLRVLDEVGLGYLQLGQSATTLSGGEAQRVKLASYLSKSNGERLLYIFDEPTTGLHFDDINKLLGAFRRLIEAGGSIIIIEHNLDVIKTADWVIDLGPEGGAAGGQLVAAGPPETIAATPESHTGRALRRVLDATAGSDI